MKMSADETVGAPAQADRLAHEAAVVAIAADAFTEAIVRVAGEPRVAGRRIVQRQ